MNKAILLGRLTRDPELRQTQSGVAVAGFSIAVNRRFKNSDGNYDVDFINCTAWRNTAEFICKYFQKGSAIAVVGSIQNQKYTDKKDGNERTATGIVVDEAYFAGSKGSGENPTASETPPEFDTSFAEVVPDDSDDDLPF